MSVPTVGYLYPFLFCGEDLIDKMDDFTRALFRQEFGDSPSKYLLAFRLSPKFFETIDLSPKPDWIIYVACGVDDPIPPGYRNAPKLMEYIWSADVSPPDYVSRYFKFLEADNPSKALAAVGTISSDYDIDWQYFEDRADADNCFWVRLVDNNTGEGATVS